MKIISSMDLGNGTTAQLREVSPSDAAAMLKHQHDRQRPFSNHRSEPFERYIATGKFLPYIDWMHVTSKIDGHEHLLNGQHRLTAISRGKEPVRIVVVTGVPLAAMDAIDTGRPRSAADILGLFGHSGGTSLSGAVNLFMRHRVGPGYKRFTPGEILEFVAENKAEIDFSRSIASEVTDGLSMSSVFGSGSVSTALIMFIHRTTGEWGSPRQFAELVRTGAGLDLSSPILHLRRMLIAMREAGHRKINKTTISPAIRVALGAKAAAFWIEGASLGQLRFVDAEEWPITDGVIDVKRIVGGTIDSRRQTAKRKVARGTAVES